jgi:hypothetical protein
MPQITFLQSHKFCSNLISRTFASTKYAKIKPLLNIMSSGGVGIDGVVAEDITNLSSITTFDLWIMHFVCSF